MEEGFDSRLSPNTAIQLLFGIKLQILAKLDETLHERGVQNRSSNDDSLFKDFNTIIAISLGATSGFEIYLTQLFHAIEEKVLQYENDNSTFIHKGSIYFNIGLVYLWSGDFDNALYFWSKAEYEDNQTYHRPNYNIFKETLFQKNFGKILNNFYSLEISREDNILRLLINEPFKYSILESFLQSKSPHHLINILIKFYKRIRYQYYFPNESTNTLYYTLIADFCIMFETELKDYLQAKGNLTQNVLGKITRKDLKSTLVGDISSEVTRIGGLYPCSSVLEYNGILMTLINDIDSESNRLTLAAKLLHLITITRNQVAHDINNSNIIYGDIDLCKRIIRLILSSIFFDKYL
jgi:hypothetical protein